MCDGYSEVFCIKFALIHPYMTLCGAIACLQTRCCLLLIWHSDHRQGPPTSAEGWPEGVNAQILVQYNFYEESNHFYWMILLYEALSQIWREPINSNGLYLFKSVFMTVRRCLDPIPVWYAICTWALFLFPSSVVPSMANWVSLLLRSDWLFSYQQQQQQQSPGGYHSRWVWLHYTENSTTDRLLLAGDKQWMEAEMFVEIFWYFIFTLIQWSSSILYVQISMVNSILTLPNGPPSYQWCLRRPQQCDIVGWGQTRSGFWLFLVFTRYLWRIILKYCQLNERAMEWPFFSIPLQLGDHSLLLDGRLRVVTELREKIPNQYGANENVKKPDFLTFSKTWLWIMLVT